MSKNTCQRIYGYRVEAFNHTSPFSGVPPTNIKLFPAEMARDESLYLTSVAVIPRPDFYSSKLDADRPPKKT